MSEAIVYSFWAEYPVGGYCESKHGPKPSGWIKEPANATFCLMSTIFGLLGIWMSRKNMSTGIMYIYSLIVGYGFTKALQHAFILNGLDKISETTLLKILQMLIVVGFAVCIRGKWPINTFPAWEFGLLLSIFGIYPAVAMVWSSSDLNPWVGWLTFDLIWFLILFEVLIIWFNRDSYKVKDPAIFLLIWYVTAAVIIGYACWLVDEFHCNWITARLNLQGWWHIFLAWGFYHCTVIIAYLVAPSYNFQPQATFYPSEQRILLATVKWVDP